MGSIAALMVAELGAILYVARLGDPKSAVTPLARPWREFAMLYLLGIIGLLSVGSFLALRTALKNPTAVLSATSQVIVIVAVMAGITALIFAPIWRYARELRTIWALLMLLLPVGMVLALGLSAAAGGPSLLLGKAPKLPNSTATIVSGVTAIVTLLAAGATAFLIIKRQRPSDRGTPPRQAQQADRGNETEGER